MKVLVTGGAGFIGSHASLCLLSNDHEVVIFDDFSNSSRVSIERVQNIHGHPIAVIEGDVNDASSIEDAVSVVRPDTIIHFAGLKSVSESVADPASYYRTNVVGTCNTAVAGIRHNVKAFLFSSSATVYGDTDQMPVTEDTATAPTNPYARSKLFAEAALRDLYSANGGMSVAVLRYFNPVGAHPSGLIGEDPKGVPSNLMPFVARVADGTYEKLKVFGDDYPTHDGTGIRDFIHVMDLAEAHVQVMEHMADHPGFEILNVGRGEGVSVRQIVDRFEEVTRQNVITEVVNRRPGDIAESYADVDRINSMVGWSARRGLNEMIADLWQWQVKNPDGYRNV